MDKLHAIRAFIEVAFAESFSKAARKMGLATSSVTRLVDGLEASLGTALLTRTTRQVALTDSGMAYLAQVSRIVADLELADDSVADDRSEPAGSLRVSVPVTFGRLCLSPCFTGYLHAYPKMSLDVVTLDAYNDLAADHIDVAIRIGEPSAVPGLIVKRLAVNERYLVASHSYAQGRQLPEKPEELAAHECIRFSYGGQQRWTLTCNDKTVVVEPAGRLTANSLDMLYDATQNAMGVALLPKWQVAKDIDSGRLLRLLENWTVAIHPGQSHVYAAYLSNRRFSRKVHAFLDFIEQHLQLD